MNLIKELYMNKIVYFSALFFAGFSSTAQVKILNYHWDTSTELSTLPDSLKNEDAVLIHYDHWISNAIFYEQDSIKPRSMESIYQRIKFLTNRGVNKYTRFYIKREKNQSFEILDARTIKPGNKVVPLTNGDLKQLVFNYSSKGTDDFVEEIRFSIPGVEAGDEVEIIYKLASARLTTGEDVFMFSNLPCMRSTFAYISDNYIRSEVKDLSSMPMPQVEKNSLYTIYRWEMKGLPGLGREENSIPTLTMPYVSIIVRVAQLKYGNNFLHDQTISPSTWQGIFDETNNYFDYIELQTPQDTSAFKKFILDKVGIPAADPSALFDQFCSFHKFICDSLSLVDWNELLENKPLLYYLRNKRADRFHLFALYRKFFETMGIKYYMGYGRNKYQGVFDTSLVASHHITENFMAVKDASGVLHYLIIGSPENKFYIDEVPYYLEGTTVALVTKSSMEPNKTEVIFRKIIPTTPDVNFHNEKIKVVMGFTNKEDSYDLRDYYSGLLSNETRHLFAKMFEKKFYNEYLKGLFPDSKMDSAVVLENSTTYPFPVTVHYFFRNPSLLTEITDSVYAISLKKLFHFAVIESTDIPRTLDYYSERKYHHQCDYQIQFEQPVEIINNKKLSLQEENQFGVLEAQVGELNSSTLMVHLDYKVKSFRLPSENYKDLKALENSFDDFINSFIIIKKL
jgi:hypothetical protein